MKAIRVSEFGNPEVMRLEDVPDPMPGPGEVVVKVHAAGVNPVDAYIRSGLYPVAPARPFTPGMDAAGVIEAVGKDVGWSDIGKRVYVNRRAGGSYAEKVVCLKSEVHPLPDHISFSQGAAIGVPYGAAYRALFQRAKGKPGETVLVHGATGGVGIAAVQLALASGMNVIGTYGTEKGRELLMEQGAHYAFDHHSPDYMAEMLKLTDGNGIDIVLEMRADVNLGKDLGVLATKGRVVVIGSRGTVEIDPREAMRRDAAILGMVLMNASEKEAESIHAALVAGLTNCTLSPVIGTEMPLSDAPPAHHRIMEESAFGKIVLIT